MNRRYTLALVALILLQAAVAPVAALAATEQQHATTQPKSLAPQTLTQSNNTTAPTTAENVRISPVRMDEKFLKVNVAKADTTFNTTGPFALFSLSEQVESARIAQQPADATVLAGGQQVKIAYSDNAAPPDSQSLYTLELYFEDGSTKTVDLYAKQTAVSVAAADLKEYAPVIDELKEFAEDHGYESNPDALLDYITWVNDRADLVDGFLSEQAARFLGGLMVLAMVPLSWVALLLVLAAFGYWLRGNFGEMLDYVQDAPERAEQERDKLVRAYENQRQTADEEPMNKIDAVGSDDILWESEFGTKSSKDLASLGANGMWRQTGNGHLEQIHGGVADLTVEDLETRDCWLENVLRDGRISVPEALGQLKNAMRRMETEYNMGHKYRRPADHAEQLIREWKQSRRTTGNVFAGDD